ncbi:MAG: hypothetical protein FWF60_06825 [Oscillospiraceae bacterium]|nr:hypothetical protein [Oscillospiraceae bacterium]
MATKLYTYANQTDSGFAPCYDDRAYTLACCKPRLRVKLFNNWDWDNPRSNDVWVMGYRRMKGGVFPVCVAKIERVIRFDEYYRDGNPFSGREDCIYREVDSLPRAKCIYGTIQDYYPAYLQLENRHHDESHARTDLYGNCVLYSEQFAHFAKGTPMPVELLPFTKNRDYGHYEIPAQLVQALYEMLKQGESVVQPWDYQQEAGAI